MVVVSHLFLFLGDKFKGRGDSHESPLPLFRTIYFPIDIYFFYNKMFKRRRFRLAQPLEPMLYCKNKCFAKKQFQPFCNVWLIDGGL